LRKKKDIKVASIIAAVIVLFIILYLIVIFITEEKNVSIESEKKEIEKRIIELQRLNENQIKSERNFFIKARIIVSIIMLLIIFVLLYLFNKLEWSYCLIENLNTIAGLLALIISFFSYILFGTLENTMSFINGRVIRILRKNKVDTKFEYNLLRKRLEYLENLAPTAPTTKPSLKNE